MSMKQELEAFAAACKLAHKEGRPTPVLPNHIPMREINLSRANLAWMAVEHRDFTNTDFRRADLTNAIMAFCSLEKTNLTSARMGRCNLTASNLYGADLSGASLVGANLHSAILHNANISDASLDGVELGNAKGIRAAGPVGCNRRMIYGVSNDVGPIIQAGCWWASLEDTIKRVEEVYHNHALRDDYLAAVKWVGGVTYEKD